MKMENRFLAIEHDSYSASRHKQTGQPGEGAVFLFGIFSAYPLIPIRGEYQEKQDNYAKIAEDSHRATKINAHF